MKSLSDKYIVVTGGAGFIGSCLIRHLNDQSITNLILVDDLNEGDKWKNLVGKRFLDIIHKERLFDWLKGREGEVEAFFHLGACSSTVEKDANFLLENNTHYSMSLAEYALKHGQRFIYASSAATYGDGSLGFSDDHETLESLRPLNMYGYSKHLFDLWLKKQNVLDQVVGLKYFNVYGPNEFHKGRMASAPSKMVPEVQQGRSIRLFKSSEPETFADGEQVRDFLYVKDAAKMTAAFLFNDHGGIYNMGCGKPQTWNALAKGVFKSLALKPQIEYFDMPSDLIGKYQNYTCADLSKVKKAGIPLPAYSLEEGITDYVQNYLVPRRYW